MKISYYSYWPLSLRELIAELMMKGREIEKIDIFQCFKKKTRTIVDLNVQSTLC